MIGMIVGVMWVNLKTWSRNVWHFWHFTHPFPSLTTWPSSSGVCIVQFIIWGIYVAIKTIKNYCKVIQKLTFLAKCPILFTFSQAILAILSYIRGICFTCPLGGGVDKYLTRPRKFKLKLINTEECETARIQHIFIYTYRFIKRINWDQNRNNL